jgi:hypothetical protein
VTRRPCSLLLFVAALIAPAAALACGEGMFNTGRGLPYQGYLAPRPAAVLVYASPDSPASDASREKLYAGLQKAGHSVTVVRDAEAMNRAIGARRYDVVISPLSTVDVVTAADATQAPAVLPVVARAARNSPEVKNRFDLFLIDGASLGQYLKAINKVVVARLP